MYRPAHYPSQEEVERAYIRQQIAEENHAQLNDVLANRSRNRQIINHRTRMQSDKREQKRRQLVDKVASSGAQTSRRPGEKRRFGSLRQRTLSFDLAVVDEPYLQGQGTTLGPAYAAPIGNNACPCGELLREVRGSAFVDHHKKPNHTVMRAVDPLTVARLHGDCIFRSSPKRFLSERDRVEEASKDASQRLLPRLPEMKRTKADMLAKISPRPIVVGRNKGSAIEPGDAGIYNGVHVPALRLEADEKNRRWNDAATMRSSARSEATSSPLTSARRTVVSTMAPTTTTTNFTAVRKPPEFFDKSAVTTSATQLETLRDVVKNEQREEEERRRRRVAEMRAKRYCGISAHEQAAGVTSVASQQSNGLRSSVSGTKPFKVPAPSEQFAQPDYLPL